MDQIFRAVSRFYTWSKFRKQENREQSISGLAVSLMAVNLILTDPNSKHHIGRI
jgi:hypothetical protein